MAEKEKLDLPEVVARLDKLENEVRYLKKKSEITPLIAQYHHMRVTPGSTDLGEEAELIIRTTDGRKFEFKDEVILARRDEIILSTGSGVRHVCSMRDITSIELGGLFYKLEG